MTNGVWQDNSRASSETNSDETVVMFNLDRLNEGRPEWVGRNAYGGGQIPKDPEALNEALVQRVNTGRFRWEVGGSSNGPQTQRLQTAGPNLDGPHFLSDPDPHHIVHSHSVSLDTGLNNILHSESIDFGPGPPYSPSIASDPGTLTNLLCED